MIQNDCDCCSKPCACPAADYYPINQICFCRPQMFFLIESIEILRDGNYPKSHIDSGYIDSIIQRQPPQAAPFEGPCQIAAEIDVRLTACKQDGETLAHEIISLQADYYELLSPAARNALNYISGWKRRKSYTKWLKDRRHRNKNVENVALKLT